MSSRWAGSSLSPYPVSVVDHRDWRALRERGPVGESLCSGGDLLQSCAPVLGVAAGVPAGDLGGASAPLGREAGRRDRGLGCSDHLMGALADPGEGKGSLFQESFVAALEGTDPDLEHVCAEGGDIEPEVAVVGGGVAGQRPPGIGPRACLAL